MLAAVCRVHRMPGVKNVGAVCIESLPVIGSAVRILIGVPDLLQAAPHLFRVGFQKSRTRDEHPVIDLVCTVVSRMRDPVVENLEVSSAIPGGNSVSEDHERPFQTGRDADFPAVPVEEFHVPPAAALDLVSSVSVLIQPFQTEQDPVEHFLIQIILRAAASPCGRKGLDLFKLSYHIGGGLDLSREHGRTLTGFVKRRKRLFCF